MRAFHSMKQPEGYITTLFYLNPVNRLHGEARTARNSE